jgi:prefoldin subunit 5
MSQNLNEAISARLDAMEGKSPVESAPAPIDEPEQDTLDQEAEGYPEMDSDPDTEASAEEHEDGEEGAETTEAGDGSQTPIGSDGTKYKIKEFAEAIGWEAADLYNDLIVPFGNGESMTLGELKNDRETLAQRQAEVQQAQAAIQQQYQQLQQQAQQLVTGQQQVSAEIENARGEVKGIEAQYANVDWEKMEEADPGRAANLRQKFATAYAQAQAKFENAQQQHQQQVQATTQQLVAQHNQILAQALPEWRDPKVYQEEAPQIHQYLQQVGFSDQELESIFDWRARYIARQAWLWQKHQSQVQQATSAVRKAPKTIPRAGKARPQRQMQEQNVRALEQQAMRSGRRGDRLQAARAILQSRK